MDEKEKLKLLASKEFNAVLAGDHILRELKNSAFDRPAETAILLDALGLSGISRIGTLPVRPLTAARWAFLWAIKSPFVENGTPTAADADVALYVFSRWDLREDMTVTLSGIPAAAAGLTAATGLPVDTVCREIALRIRNAFLPLAMQQSAGSADPEDTPPVFDLDWLTRIGGIAAREGNMTFPDCIHLMPLSALCALYVNYRRREGADGAEIARRLPDTVLDEIDRRIDALAEEFLCGKEEKMKE